MNHPVYKYRFLSVCLTENYSSIYGPILSKLVSNFCKFFEDGDDGGFFKFFIPPLTHPPTHSRIYGPIFSKLVPKFCNFFGDGYYMVFLSFTPPSTRPLTHPHTHVHTRTHTNVHNFSEITFWFWRSWVRAFIY